jgi:transposase
LIRPAATGALSQDGRRSDVLGIDLAKQVFQLHGADRKGQALHRAKVSRAGLMAAITALKPKLVVMEACSSAHHWARRLKA